MKFFVQILLCSIFLLQGQMSYGQAEDDKAGHFLRLGIGARAAARGGAFTAVANDVSAIYWNPAGLVNLNRTQAQLSLNRHPLGAFQSFVAVATPYDEKWAFGIGLASLNVSSNDARPGDQAQPDFVFSKHNRALYFSLAHKIKDDVMIGTNAKMFYSDKYGANAFGGGFDLAMMIEANDQMKIGIGVQDIGSGVRWNDDLGEDFPLTLRTGFLLHSEAQVAFSLDMLKSEGMDARFSLGVVYEGISSFPVRAGYDGNGLTGGSGFKVPISTMTLYVDYGFTANSLGRGASYHLSAGVDFNIKNDEVIDRPAIRLKRRNVQIQEVLELPLSNKKRSVSWVQILASGLNVRLNPGVGHKKVAVVYKGEKYRKLTSNGVWVKIKLKNSKTGWVHKKHIKAVPGEVAKK